MPPTVLWIHVAEERLAAALRRTTERVATSDVEQTAISARLAAAFPRALHVVVLDYFVGFAHRPGEHILQVELKQPGEANTLVVKIAKPERLQREKDAWDLARLEGTNPVFMPLRVCPEGAAADRLVAIAYQHAQQHIGADTAVWLETAVRDCVRFHSVTLESILAVLGDLYAQTGRLYSSGRLEPAGIAGIQTTPTRKAGGERHGLASSLDLWNEPAVRPIRQQVNAAFAVGATAFLDPVDAFRFWNDALKQPAPADLLPQVMRGLAHGDLHGRNSIVGIDPQGHANFPTLFDYESIHPDNLIGWDFVEMEVELKIRIYDKIFPHARRATWIREIQQFEADLNYRTRQCVDSRSWPGSQGLADTPRDRLLAVLLTIRHKASSVLSCRPRTPEVEWLREYLFLMGCYGLMSVRYKNQTDLERTAAYVSAGVAAARLEVMHGASPEPAADVDQVLAESHVTCQIPLRRARQWNRTKLPADLASAERLLSSMVERYPTTLHVHYEQAFNFVKQKRSADALSKLEKLHDDFAGSLDEDTWSLWGRCFKDLGDAKLVAGVKAEADSAKQKTQFEEADECYRDALAKYESAYALAGGFFSGINVATLKFLRAALCKRLGREEESRLLRSAAHADATQLKKTRSQWHQQEPDDDIWVRATEAEVFALLKQCDHAGEKYRAAVDRQQCLAFHPETMGRQLARILEGYRLLGEPVSLEAFGDLGPIKPHVTLE